MNGGVARNIAECMSKLGRKPFMVSVVGSDMAGEVFSRLCSKASIKLSVFVTEEYDFISYTGEQLLKYWHSAGLSTEGNYRYRLL